MMEEIIVAGSGGQGVLVLGEILALGSIDHDLNATWLPSYGPEMRGGTANCSVVISDEEIGSPTIDEPNIFVCFNQPSMLKFGAAVVPGGLIIANADAIVDYPELQDGVDLIKINAGTLAVEAGSERAINIVMLGALLSKKPMLNEADVEKALRTLWGEKRAEKLLPMNMKALEMGKQAVDGGM